ARTCRTLSLLLQSGLPLLDALDIAAQVAGNRTIERALLAVTRGVREGGTLADMMHQTGAFTSLVTQLVATGEESGSLAAMLGKAAVYYEAQVDAAGGLAGLAGLALGVAWSRRIWAIVERTDAAVPTANGFPAHRVPDELGALDVAVGRLTLSMDRFVSDSDILARLPAAMLLVDDARRLLVFNVTAETLLGPDLARFRGRPLLGVDGPLPVARGNEPLADVMGEAERAGAALHVEEVQASTWSG